jgi:large subunit ribosomal protein L18
MRIGTKKARRARIQMRLRKRVAGTAERPRLAVFRSDVHIYAQVIDDTVGRTVVSAASTEAGLKAKVFTGTTRGGNLAGAEALGRLIAERLREKGISRVVFDRGGNLYHGRVRAVADAARKAGLEF